VLIASAFGFRAKRLLKFKVPELQDHDMKVLFGT
jgi:hypothetical protein